MQRLISTTMEYKTLLLPQRAEEMQKAYDDSGAKVFKDKYSERRSFMVFAGDPKTESLTTITEAAAKTLHTFH